MNKILFQDFKKLLKELDENIIMIRGQNGIILRDIDFNCIKKFNQWSELLNQLEDYIEEDLDLTAQIKSFVIDCKNGKIPTCLTDLEKSEYLPMYGKINGISEDSLFNQNKKIIGSLKYNFIPDTIRVLNYLVLSSINESKEDLIKELKIEVTNKDKKKELYLFDDKNKNQEVGLNFIRQLYKKSITNPNSLNTQNVIDSYILFRMIITFNENDKIEDVEKKVKNQEKIKGYFYDESEQGLLNLLITFFSNSSDTANRLIQSFYELMIKPSDETKDKKTEVKPSDETKDKNPEVKPTDETKDKTPEVKPTDETKDKTPEVKPTDETKGKTPEVKSQAVGKEIFTEIFYQIDLMLSTNNLKIDTDKIVFKNTKFNDDEKSIIIKMLSDFNTKFQGQKISEIIQEFSTDSKNSTGNIQVIDGIKTTFDSNYLKFKGKNQDGKQVVVSLDASGIEFTDTTNPSDFIKKFKDVVETSLSKIETIVGGIESVEFENTVETQSETTEVKPEDVITDTTTDEIPPVETPVEPQKEETKDVEPQVKQEVKPTDEKTVEPQKDETPKDENDILNLKYKTKDLTSDFLDFITKIKAVVGTPKFQDEILSDADKTSFFNKIYEYIIKKGNTDGVIIVNDTEVSYSIIENVLFNIEVKNSTNDKTERYNIKIGTDLQTSVFLDEKQQESIKSNTISSLKLGGSDINLKNLVYQLPNALNIKSENIFNDLFQFLSPIENFSIEELKVNKIFYLYRFILGIIKNNMDTLILNGTEIKYSIENGIVMRIEGTDNNVKYDTNIVTTDGRTPNLKGLFSQQRLNSVKMGGVDHLFIGNSKIDVIPILTGMSINKDVDKNDKTKLNNILSDFLSDFETEKDKTKLYEKTYDKLAILSEFFDSTKNKNINALKLASNIFDVISKIIYEDLRKLLKESNDTTQNIKQTFIKRMEDNNDIFKRFYKRDENGEVIVDETLFEKLSVNSLVIDTSDRIKYHNTYKVKDETAYENIISELKIQSFIGNNIDVDIDTISVVTKCLNFFSNQKINKMFFTERVISELNDSITQENKTKIKKLIVSPQDSKVLSQNVSFKVIQKDNTFKLNLQPYIVRNDNEIKTYQADTKYYESIILSESVIQKFKQNGVPIDVIQVLKINEKISFGDDLDNIIDFTEINFDGAYIEFKKNTLDVILRVISKFKGKYVNLRFYNYLNQQNQIEISETNSSKPYSWMGENIGENAVIGNASKISYVFNVSKIYKVNLQNMNAVMETDKLINHITTLMRDKEVKTDSFLLKFYQNETPAVENQADKKETDIREDETKITSGIVKYKWGYINKTKDEKTGTTVNKFKAVIEGLTMSVEFKHTPIYYIRSVNLSNLSKLKNTDLNGRFWYFNNNFYYGFLPIAGSNANTFVSSIAKKSPTLIRRFMNNIASYSLIGNSNIRQDEGANFVRLEENVAGSTKVLQIDKHLSSNYLSFLKGKFLSKYKKNEQDFIRSDKKQEEVASTMKSLQLDSNETFIFQSFIVSTINFLTSGNYTERDIMDSMSQDNFIEKLKFKVISILTDSLSDEQEKLFITTAINDINKIIQYCEKIQSKKSDFKNSDYTDNTASSEQTRTIMESIFAIIDGIRLRYGKEYEEKFKQDMDTYIGIMNNFKRSLNAYNGTVDIESIIAEHFYTTITKASEIQKLLGNNIKNYSLYYAKLSSNKQTLICHNSVSPNSMIDKYDIRLYIDIQYVKGDLRMISNLLNAILQGGGLY